MNFDDAIISEASVQGVPPVTLTAARNGKLSNYQIYGNSNP